MPKLRVLSGKEVVVIFSQVSDSLWILTEGAT